ncbi:hypothetical protein EVAR_63745_1 [Eumeta japonica]|uniref:RNA-directed DNA polymerase from mobile element jockey n=1 Tax=Eumeta variegata TaxID=151549 RepID=A0A4C1ZM43_EUMVA|nr:hypothetical protein EVAR_63745_1 [Eumeta japonica]
MTGHRTLVIVSIYLSPSKKLPRNDIEAHLALGDTVIFFGDFDCKNTNWGCAVSYPGGWDLPSVVVLNLRKITDWKRVSTVFKEVDTPAFNIIPDVIETTNEIDSSIGSTNRIRMVVKVLTGSSCVCQPPKLPADALELLRAKNAALRQSCACRSRENRSRS